MQVPIAPACDTLTAACSPTVCATAEVALAQVAGLGMEAHQRVLVQAAAGMPASYLHELLFRAFNVVLTAHPL